MGFRTTSSPASCSKDSTSSIEHSKSSKKSEKLSDVRLQGVSGWVTSRKLFCAVGCVDLIGSSAGFTGSVDCWLGFVRSSTCWTCMQFGIWIFLFEEKSEMRSIFCSLAEKCRVIAMISHRIFRNSGTLRMEEK